MFTFRKNGHFYEKVSKKGEPVCIDEEIPFDIPDSWEWCRFGYVVDFSLGKTPPRKELIFWDNATTPWVTISDMVDGKIINCTQENVNNYALEKSFKGILVPKGTLLMSFKLTVGKVSILGLDAVHNEAIISIKPFIDNNNCFRDYLFRVLPLISQTGDTKSAIKGKTLNSKSLNKLLIPLPPLNEQRCIVNKIEDIMPFIEEYGVDKEQLDKLNSEFPDKLKSSILQEAIQGKLVSQDSNDEPSSVLLERIRNEKERLIKEKKIKRNKNESYIFKENNHFYEKIGDNEPECIDSDIPFEIPESWHWYRLGEISFITKLAGFEYSKYIAPNITNEGIPLLKAKYIKEDKLLKNFEHFIPKELSDSLIRSKVNKRCILTPYVGASIGNVILFDGLYEAHLAPNLAKIVMYGSISEKYIVNYIKSPFGYLELTKYMKSTAQPSISMAALRDMLVPIPSLKEQKEIIKRIEMLFEILNI